MMLYELLCEIKKNEKIELVTTNDLMEKLNEKELRLINEDFSPSVLNDLRSATFFASGEAESIDNQIIMLIDGNYLPNIYTGITESWFQRINIIIIAIYPKFDDIKVDYIKRVIPNILNIYNDSIDVYLDEIEGIKKSNYPGLITIKYDLKEKKYNYSDVFEKINTFLSNEDKVMVFEQELISNYNFEIINIKEKYRYGLISKYMGYIVGKKKKVLLCVQLENLLVDLNIFNNRYLNDNFKIIIIDNKKRINKIKIDQWIKNNKINVRIETNPQINILEEFWKSNSPEVLVIGGEE